MEYSHGDEVTAARTLGLLGQVPRGTEGVVREAGFLGDYTVEFENGATVRGLRGSDLEPALLGPWWAQPRVPSDADRGGYAGEEVEGPSRTAVRGSVALRLAGVLLFLVLFAYAVSQLL